MMLLTFLYNIAATADGSFVVVVVVVVVIVVGAPFVIPLFMLL